jgi:hypothetical protein
MHTHTHAHTYNKRTHTHTQTHTHTHTHIYTQRFIPSVDTGEGGGLDVLMGPLCDEWIDVLRPLYIKVVDVEVLCALAVILKGEVSC